MEQNKQHNCEKTGLKYLLYLKSKNILSLFFLNMRIDGIFWLFKFLLLFFFQKFGGEKKKMKKKSKKFSTLV